MKRTPVIVLAVCLALFVLSSCGYSQEDLDRARTESYEKGLAAGYQSGYETGFAEGNLTVTPRGNLTDSRTDTAPALRRLLPFPAPSLPGRAAPFRQTTS